MVRRPSRESYKIEVSHPFRRISGTGTKYGETRVVNTDYGLRITQNPLLGRPELIPLGEPGEGFDDVRCLDL